jgi:HEAT repeat protein
MARSLSQSLLAVAVAAVVGGAALAQDTPLQEAATLLRLNKKEEATAKLREILAGDPSNADAMQMYRSISQDEWYLLMTQKDADGNPSEIQKIAIAILDRAKAEKKVRSRDEATISGLVATATAKDSDYGARQKAINSIVAEHGEFAVPALVEKLGNRDDADGQIQAVAALTQLRTHAVLPLLAALGSSNLEVVQNAAAALKMIGDDRALPAMLHLANDERPSVRDIARKFVTQKNAGGSAVDAYLAQAREYLKGNVAAGAWSDVVWTMAEDKLVAADVPALLYPAELAKHCAMAAMGIAPSAMEPRVTFAQSCFAQANLIDQGVAGGDESMKALEAVSADLKAVALAAGRDAVRSALDAGNQAGLAPVAIGAIGAIGGSGTAMDSSALANALGSGDKRVRYAAAEALVKATGGVNVASAGKVVEVLAAAVGEQAVHMVHVVAPLADANAAVAEVDAKRGFAVSHSADAVSGMAALLTNPNVDFLVVSDILPDRLPQDVIGNVKKDPRMANCKIAILCKDEEAAKAKLGDGYTFIKAPLTGEALAAAATAALEGSSDPAKVRAEAYAASASASLAAMAAGGSDIKGAVATLCGQLDRADAVAVPAAKALGMAGADDALKALSAALGGGGSVELKRAAASGIGNILERGGKSDEAVAALRAAMDTATDAGLRVDLGAALGKASLSAEARLEALRKYTRVASAPKSEG